MVFQNVVVPIRYRKGSPGTNQLTKAFDCLFVILPQELQPSLDRRASAPAMVTLILASTARINWCHVTALCLDPFFNFVPLDFRQEPLPDFGRVLDVDPH